MRYRIDTSVAGAFLNIYTPIGNDPVVKCLDGDADMCDVPEYSPEIAGTYVSINEMCREAQRYINFLNNKILWQQSLLKTAER